MLNIKMLKKIFLSIFTALFLLVTVSIPLVKAEGVWYDQSYKEWKDKVYNKEDPQEIFGERYTAAQVQWILYSLMAQIDKFAPEDVANCNKDNKEACALALTNFFTSLISQAGKTSENTKANSVLSFFTNNPASGIGYVINTLSRLHLVPQAYAQEAGFGYKNISITLNFWRVIRNFAYALTTIAVVVMAFMIMFRVKINPQTVITVQSTIPKVAITLILITFSYAIAGFMVDLMYVVIGLGAAIVSALPPSVDFSTWYYLMTSGFLGLGIIGNYILYGILFFVGLMFSGAGASVLGSTIPGLAIWFVISLVITIILLILFIWHSIKTIFLLFKTIASIYIAVIFAPIQIGLGLINQGMGFGVWLKGLVANLAVFVVISFLFALGTIFGMYGFLLGLINIMGNNQWLFDLLALTNDAGLKALAAVAKSINETLPTAGVWPLFRSANIGDVTLSNIDAIIFLGVSFVMITLIPKASDIIKSVIEGKPFAYGTGIGEDLGTARRAGYWAGTGAEYYGGRMIARGTEAAIEKGGKLRKLGEFLQATTKM